MLVGTGKQPSSEEMVACVWRCGFVFTKEDLTEVKDSLLPNKMPAAAHADAIAPCGIIGSGRPLFQALDILLTSPGVISPLKF